MLRLPAVAGRFYPSDPTELASQIRRFCALEVPSSAPSPAAACLVPHAGYMYSGHVAGAVFAKLTLPSKVIVLGVRHSPRGKPAAVLSSGAWRTPLGDAPVDSALASEITRACPLLVEDSVAHESEHSLEVQIPFLQTLVRDFTFVPIALGTIHFDSLARIGQGIAQVLKAHARNVLLLTTSDLNHYEDDTTTRRKDHLAIDRLLELDPRGLYDVCANENISMCGLGPAVAMLTALRLIGTTRADLVKYATSADVSRDTRAVVGYVGMTFS